MNFQRMWLLTIRHPPTLLPHFRAQANVLLVRECAEHWTHHGFFTTRMVVWSMFPPYVLPVSGWHQPLGVDSRCLYLSEPGTRFFLLQLNWQRGQHSSTIIQCLKKKERWCTKFEEQDIWVSGCGAAVIAKKRDWKRVLECKAKAYDPIILQLGD